MSETSPLLTPRWYPLRPHAGQSAYFTSLHRFNCLPCGRRSGKTECAKRKLVRRAVLGSTFLRPRYFAAAPTRDQAEKIYWQDLLELVPPELIGTVYKSNLTIFLTTGASISVVGLDKPARIEGSPWDGGILDEYANMKATAWPENVFPALADRNGWCDLIGVPEKKNHYYQTCLDAKALMRTRGEASSWGHFHWVSADILSADQIEEAQRSMSPSQYRQEFEAAFEDASGAIFESFSREENVRECPIDWRNSDCALHIGIDFNTNPMSAVTLVKVGGLSYIVDEFSEKTSNTNKLIEEIKRRPGYVRNGSISHVTTYPDATGSRLQTSSDSKSDHMILRAAGFKVVAAPTNPDVRASINLTNAFWCSALGSRRLFVSAACKQAIKCYESYSYKEGTSEPDKSKGVNDDSHLPDATRYVVWGMNHVPKAEAKLTGWRQR